MHLQISFEKLPTPDESNRLARALLILGGSDAIVSRAIEGVALQATPSETREFGNGRVVRPPAPGNDAEQVALLAAGIAEGRIENENGDEITLGDAAALLAHGGVLPPPGAGTDSTPALPSGNAVAPPPGTAALTAEVRLDSASMPYDIRIHSGAMSTKKDGTWTAKRGVSELLIAQVEGEHHAAGYGQPVSPGVTTTIAPAPAAGTTVVTPPPSGVAPPPAAVPGPPADANAFRELVNVMGTKMQGGELNKAQIDGALAAIGLKAIPELQQNLHLIDTLKLHLGL